MIKLACLLLLAIVVISAAIAFGVLLYQGKQKPIGNPQYVALGSSFAAGIGLGKRDPGSPLICMRSEDGYPQQLARMRGLSLVDVSCSGATSEHVLRGGQMFLGPQIDALGVDTELVTMTIGGNDIRYVGDLSFMAGRKDSSLFGWGLRRFWGGPLTPAGRDYQKVRARLTAILKETQRRAPRARIVVLTYPMILPPVGTCPKLNIDAHAAEAMRTVGEHLAEVTRSAAKEGGAILVDMQHIGADHHACSGDPWVNGWIDAVGTQFHPTIEGSKAMAIAIAEALDRDRTQRVATPVTKPR